MEKHKYTVHDREFWKIIASLLLASLFIFANIYAVQPLLPVFVTDFGVSVSTSSLSLSLTIIGLIAGLVILGFFSDRNGRRAYIIWSLAGSAIPFFILPFVESFSIFLALRLLQGFALAGVPAAALAYISEEIDRKNIAYATALYISSNALGGMLGRVLTGFLTDAFSWQMTFFAFGSTGLALFIAVFFLLPHSYHFEPSELSFSKDIEGFLFHLKNPALLVVFGLGAILQIAFTGVWTYLPFHLEAPPFSMSLQAISYLFFAYGIGVIGSPLAGRAAETFGLRRVRIIGVFIFSAGVLMTLGTELWMVAVGLCITCLGFFTAHSLTAASVGQQAAHHKGSASSLYLVSYYIGVAAGSSLLSPIWTRFGWNVLILLCAIMPALYVLIVTWYRKRAASIA
ncbi:MFS transporter [Planococcus sp. CP5-4]|uniref:MFS transporter n=1 Tax=unclassified Planococcus (in: firmicutes) TaxID=2662419 RepID=UPI001C22E8AF|nr:MULTISPECIES: MFS transporter [unclassified Planococcus (in: firmicutes)]MBU9673146.1 MFS transporter [Planococcus sp. CP5-4_YE]MBW6062454.1 MFS transporter [Planococcus sp. CP5-4]